MLPLCLDDHDMPRRENVHPRPSDAPSTHQRPPTSEAASRLPSTTTRGRGPSYHAHPSSSPYFQVKALTRGLLRPNLRSRAEKNVRRRDSRLEVSPCVHPRGAGNAYLAMRYRCVHHVVLDRNS